MTELQIGLLLTQLFVGLTLLVYIGIKFLHAKEESYKYRMYATRDRLVYSVATSELAETSMVFKVFYRAMNTYIANLDSLTMVSFIKASLAVKTELEKENQQRLVDALQRTAPEVQQTINEFIRVVMDALRYNSPLLNLVIITAHHCGRLFSSARIRFRTDYL